MNDGEASSSADPDGHAARMDGNYRWQRHVYDLTRRYYLFGRDRLLRTLDPQPDECILEAGCGTARNLLALARREPRARLFGLDASALMLETAGSRLARSGNAPRISLRCELAERLDYRGTFGLDTPFDAAFFSYALSMIPPWRSAIGAAWENLRPGGRLLAVDFWDAAGVPFGFGRVLRAWLSRFHTYPRPEIIPFIAELPGGEPMRIETVGPRYAFLISRRKL
jgi:S-adenosylmethionine-diacylgycerolhomoserine-N-methlytransferase